MQNNQKEQLSALQKSFFDLQAVNIEGQLVSLSIYSSNKAIVIVNVACKCGLTADHYTQLVELYQKYHSQGLEILGFPCNQFGAQEPGTENEIKQFTTEKFGVCFPLFSKIEVNGENCHEIYQWLRQNSELKTEDGSCKLIPWNFAKFLINPSGQVVKYFSPKENPVEMVGLIEQLLSK